MSQKFLQIMIIGYLIQGFFLLGTNVYATVIGLKSANNTVANIIAIEKDPAIGKLPIVGFIFDDFGDKEQQTLVDAVQYLGRDRIYHITLSPKTYTAGQVALGIYDDKYVEFFTFVKNNDILVVFRTMHEMNGGRYAWGSDPYNFINARKHVHGLAYQTVGLDTNNILFNFSVNHRDAPTNEPIPHKQAALTFCEPINKITKSCATFEDYYPGDAYVDLVGVSFYNRGRAVYDRVWLRPEQILMDPRRNTRNRLLQIGKPIFIDEVGTTSVYYTGRFDASGKKAREAYNTLFDYKNRRLEKLGVFMKSQSSLVGAMYFNSDFTQGLSRYTPGETDWSVYDIYTNKRYFAIYDLIRQGAQLSKSKLLDLFDHSAIRTQQGYVFVKKKYINEIYQLANFFKNKTSEEQNLIINNFMQINKNNEPDLLNNWQYKFTKSQQLSQK